MNIVWQNIGFSQSRPIYFSHVVDHPKSTQHAPHLHDYVGLFFYVSGDVDFLLDDTYLRLCCGDVIVATENVLHKPIIKSDARYEREIKQAPCPKRPWKSGLQGRGFDLKSQLSVLLCSPVDLR